MTELTVSAQFEITLTPCEGLLPETGRFDFRKTWSGGMEGTSQGLMLSVGDPSKGTAGYVALERFEGTIEGRHGALVFQQFGTMAEGADATLYYMIGPGSGTEQLAGALGEVVIDIIDGVHHASLRLELPEPPKE